MTTVDVLVVGAGPAGAVAARVLALAGRSVLLLDQLAETASKKIGESLPGSARPLLRDLGLLDMIAGRGHLPYYGNVSAWGDPHPVATDAILDPNGAGWHLDRRGFDAMLREAALDAGALWRSGRLRSFSRENGYWQAQLDQAPVQARWMIDASGRHAAVARRLGIARREDEPLVALYAWGRDASRDQRTLIEAVPEGWWYTAPLPCGQRVIALHVQPGLATYLRRPEMWQACLQRTRHIQQLCAPQGMTEPRGTEATGASLDQFAGEGWLAVGDAALCFDPLSSQGMFNALYTGLRGGQAVHAALAQHPEGIPQYVERLQQVRSIYRHRVQYYYRSEKRWPHEPFWRERHAAA